MNKIESIIPSLGPDHRNAIPKSGSKIEKERIIVIPSPPNMRNSKATKAFVKALFAGDG